MERNVVRNSLYTSLIPLVGEGVAASAMADLDPIYQLLDTQVPLEPAANLSAVMLRQDLAYATGIDLPVRFVAASDFPPDLDSPEIEVVCERLRIQSLWSMNELLKHEDLLLSQSSETAAVETAVTRCVTQPFMRAWDREHHYMDDFAPVLPSGMQDETCIGTFVRHSLEVSVVPYLYGLIRKEYKYVRYRRLIEWIPRAIVLGQNVEKSEWIALCR